MKKISLILSILYLISCQRIVIEDNEAGVLFKKFDGGTDTTQFFDTGKHSINAWDRVIKYDTSIKSNSIEFAAGNDSTITINYTYQLPKSNTPKYHDMIGGEPETYSEKAIYEILNRLTTDDLNKLYDGDRQNFEKSIRIAMETYFLQLNQIEITRT